MTVFSSVWKQDTFTRANQSGWNPASNGDTWTVTTGTPTLSIASNEGKATGVAASDWVATLGSTTITDTELLVHCTISDFGNDGLGVYLRYVDSSNWYRVFLYGGSLAVDKKVAGTFTGTVASSAFSPVNNTFYWIRVHMEGTQLQAKVWSGTLGSEPGTYSITVTMSGVSGAGKVGLGAYHNATGDISQFDNFTAYQAGPTANKRSLGLRTKVRTQRLRSIGLRLIAGNPIVRRSLGLRTRVSTARNKSLGIRSQVRSLHNLSIPIRLSTFGHSLRSLGLRANIYSPGFRTLGLRVVVRGATGAYAVNIAGMDVFVDSGSLSVENTIGKRSTASFTVITDTSTHFYQYQQCWIYDQSGYLIFSGYITQPQEKKLGFAQTLIHTITATDQHYLADKRVLAAQYTNKSIGFIVTNIVSTILSQEGVTLADVYDGIFPSTTLYPSPTLYPTGNVGLIPTATFAYCTVAQALDALASSASASGVPYFWSIDKDKKLYFVPYSAISNTTVVDGSMIDEQVNTPTLSRQNPTYRNTQYVTGGVAETVTQTETRVGDGNTQAWTMGYELAHVPTVQVNTGSGYVTKTVGIKGVDSGKDFYWSKGDPVITQDSAGTILRGSPNNDMLKVIYIGQYPTVSIAQDSGQVMYQAKIDGTSGIVESCATDSNITSSGNGLNEAGQLLTRYAQQGVQLTFTTRDPSFIQGQLRIFDLPHHDLNNVQMLVTDVVATDQYDGVNIYYNVTAVLGPYDVSWQDFFSQLLKQQTPVDAINVGVNQSLTILASITTSLTMTPDITGTVLPSLLPNVNLYPSTTLYPA